MPLSPLLAQPHLCFITRYADHELSRIQEVIEHKVLVDGRGELEEALGQLLCCKGVSAPKTLDLIGYSTAGQSLLLLGDWVLDASSSIVTAFFRELADHDVLGRLNIHSVRLLGCQTADTEQGRATLCAISDILGVEVYGTSHLIYAAHYGHAGFKDSSLRTLVCSSDLRREHVPSRGKAEGQPYPRVLDIDALPSAPLTAREHPWPLRLASMAAARTILQLVRRSEGAQMPGLLASPSCEIALPAARPSWYHLAQVLLDFEFVRVYPEGPRRPGIMFPVEDPNALRALVNQLPSALPTV
ncbi:MAG: hypothetical protein H6Q90_3754 [Deltaproteobacteria bacterium]|nr:hypothetical protein [Deltaproteobacteria bacterium]